MGGKKTQIHRFINYLIICVMYDYDTYSATSWNKLDSQTVQNIVCELGNSEMYCYVAIFLKLWLDESKTEQQKYFLLRPMKCFVTFLLLLDS